MSIEVCDRCYQPNDVGEHGLGLCPFERRRDAAVVWADDIPGGIDIEHGLCHEDGSPQRFYSRGAIRRACQQKGLVSWSDAHSEDATKDARVQMDWARSGEAQRQKAERREMRRAGVHMDAPAQRPQAPRDERTVRVAREVVGARTPGEARERAERVARDVYRR